MRRELKKLAARLLPEALKAPLRGRLYGYRPTSVRPALAFEPAADGEVASLGHGLRLRIPPEVRDDVLFHFETNGASVEEMEGFRRAAAGEGGVLFDVGAHRSLFSHVFCLSRPGNRAVAYEPSPVLLAGGRDLAARNGTEERILFRGAAIGREAGRVRARIDESGFFHPAVPGDGDAVEVEITTLDAECERLGMAPDVVKVDIEGYEHEALLGARELLRTRRPALFLELHLDILEKRGIPPREVVEELRRHGYRFHTPLGRGLSAREVYDSVEAVLRLVAR